MNKSLKQSELFKDQQIKLPSHTEEVVNLGRLKIRKISGEFWTKQAKTGIIFARDIIQSMF